jgi:hypothetical protein
MSVLFEFLFLMLSNAMLVSEPLFSFIAAMAKLAVSPRSSITVELPLSNELAASVILVVEGCHLGSNQSAWKSKMDKTSTKSKMEQ